MWYHLGFPEMPEAIMAKKKAGVARMTQATAEEAVTRHARIELPDDDYQRLKRAADRVRISFAAYIRPSRHGAYRRRRGTAGHQVMIDVVRPRPER